MRFTPVSEEQAQTVNLFPKGIYDAVVKIVLEKTSKTSGNPMFEVELTVYGPEGKERNVRDYIVCTDAGQAKLQRFCKACGQWDAYQSGELCGDTFSDASLRVKLGIDEGTGEYPPKNKVVDYLPTPPKAAAELEGVSAAQRKAGGNLPDGDIPF